MGDVQPAAGRTRDASGLRLLLVLLLLIHGGDMSSQATGAASRADRSDQWMHVKCKNGFWSDVYAGSRRQELRRVCRMATWLELLNPYFWGVPDCCGVARGQVVEALEPKEVNERSKKDRRE